MLFVSNTQTKVKINQNQIFQINKWCPSVILAGSGSQLGAFPP